MSANLVAVLYLVAGILFILALPVTALVSVSLVPALGVPLTWQSMTFDGYVEVLSRQTVTIRAFQNSGFLATMTTVILVVAVVPFAYFIAWRKSRLARVLSTIVEIPYAMPGILTGTILSIGRAAGETAPILLTAVAFFLPILPRGLFDQVMALPYHLYVLATQHPDTAAVGPMQYGTAFVLLLIVLGFNLVALALRHCFRKQYKW